MPVLINPYAYGNQEPDPHWASVQLLLRGEGTNGDVDIVNSASSGLVVGTAGQVQLSDTHSKWGSTAIKFDGFGDYIVQDNTVWDSSQSYTIETWIYVENSGSYSIFEIGNDTGNAFSFSFSAPHVNAWHHFAVCQTTGMDNCKLYFDGVDQGILSTNFPINNDFFTIGTNHSSRNTTSEGAPGAPGGLVKFNGWMSDFRATLGVNRYPTTCVPPTGPFPGF